ncbi:formyl transferase [Campylobacter sp. RM9753]|nr:formyl transferase [Campylobacter sp. RM9753]
MNFKKIYIIGSGRVAKKCQKIAENFFKKEVISIKYTHKNDMNIFFDSITKSLIISVNNIYIFKKQHIAKNIIINYHNSLLPKYRGINAHIWAIWHNEPFTGITWHLIDNGIDTGDILFQKKIKIESNLTSLQLLKMQHLLASETFKICLENLKNCRAIPQKSTGSCYKRSELPNKGYLNLFWDREKIFRFLRAMDCGSFNGVKKPRLKILGEDKEILLYQINKFDLILNLSDNTTLKITKDENANC